MTKRGGGDSFKAEEEQYCSIRHMMALCEVLLPVKGNTAIGLILLLFTAIYSSPFHGKHS
jgi:hypothetical protein